MTTFVRQEDGKLVNANVATGPDLEFDHEGMRDLFLKALDVLKKAKIPDKQDANAIYEMYRLGCELISSYRSRSECVYHDDKLLDDIHSIWSYVAGHCRYLPEWIRELKYD